MLDRLRPEPAQLRVALPAGLAWGGAALLIGAPSLVPAVVVGATVLAAGAVLLLHRGRRAPGSRWGAPAAQTVLEHAALTFALLAAIAIATGFGAARRWPPALDDAADRPVELVLRTEETLHPGDQAPWAAMVVLLDGAPAEVPALVLDTRPSLDRAVPIGAEIALRARAVPTEPGEERAVLLDVLGDAIVAAEPGGVAGLRTPSAKASEPPRQTCPATAACCCPDSPSATPPGSTRSWRRRCGSRRSRISPRSPGRTARSWSR
ncbi:hypothetical protein [Arenivirga flava]|uniref:DUF4131 domain-containing protein n=1 Tax=Arenivirga flava TaxID=1930060 RepID=A0AA37UCU3_9MICO|nr:hypothetical protein [Arenivirga flava]GMA27004.1 hypothetical protein GCM10025874_02570 [Arenivirga flava]